MNNEPKYNVGNIYDSVNYGKFKIIDINRDENLFTIQFENTGSIRTYIGTNGIKEGLVRDLEQDYSQIKYHIGDILEGNKERLYKIIDFVIVNGKRKVKVEFLKTGYRTVVSPTNIPVKSITDRTFDDFIFRKYNIGDTIISNKGVEGIILDSENITQKNGRKRRYLSIEIKETGFVVYCTPDNYKRDKFKDLLQPSVFGYGKLGYIDNIIKENNCLLRDVNEYRIWVGIIERACIPHIDKELSYNEVTIDDRWLRFDYFYEDIKEIKNYKMWKKFKQEYPNVKNIFELDKDTLTKDNKVYSKNTCIFLPKFINAGYTSWAKDNVKENLLKEMENLTYESIVNKARELRYL